MTYDQTRVENTVPIGGNLKMRTEELDVTSYTGDGEDFSPVDVNMRRFVFVLALETSDADQWAKYAEDDETVRLYDDAGELAGGATGTVKVVAVGV